MQISVPLPGPAVVQTWEALSIFLAIWMAMDPTPPPPPGMKTLAPSFTSPVRRACRAVRPTNGIEAASAKDMLLGFLAVSAVSQTTYSARAPYFIPLSRTKTSSPLAKSVTSDPTSSTMPETSYPKTLVSYGSGLVIASPPDRRILSIGLRAQAHTLMRISPAWSMAGLGMVFTSRTSPGSPNAEKHTAFMVAPDGWSGMLGLLCSLPIAN
mmetsp:Transcript_32612/g.96124  ORF Transcript_32612/g.96124 Transcript_32612/m.96124 type:complete len:211 (+) Transcript_32612:98-730(+)